MIKDTRVHLVDSYDEAQEFFRWLDGHDVIAIDTETTGLDPETDQVRLIQIGDAHDGWVLRADRWAGVLEDVVRKYEGRYVGHNIKYDVAMLRMSLGIQLPTDRCDDTRVMVHLLEPLLSTGLKNAAARHVDASASSMDKQLHAAFKSAGWTWSTVPVLFEPYWAYAAVDTILTARLYQELKPRVDGMMPNAYDLEMAASWVLERMERLGVHVDVPYASGVKQQVDQFVRESADWCKSEYGVAPGANADVIRVLQAEGFEFSKATASGAMSLDKDVLGQINHPLAQTVLQRRQLQKVSSTYLKNFIGVGEGGRLHPHINPLGARTGRMSMSDPNFQNLPRGATSVAKTVRSCLTAEEENTLISCDFDQIEMRVMAHLAQDQPLRDAFLTDVDFFTAMARRIYADDTIVKSDTRRQTTKNAGYAKIYGAGASKFALTAQIPEAEAHAFMHAFDMRYPGVHALQQQVHDTAAHRFETEGIAYVTSPITGRRHPADDGCVLYPLVNYLIQGTAAEVFKMKLVELDLAGVGEYMMLPIHDEILLECPFDEVDEVSRIVSSVMNDKDLLTVPITAGIGSAFRWGDIPK